MSYRRSKRSFADQTGSNEFTEYNYSILGKSGKSTTTCCDALCMTVIGFILIITSIITQFITEQNYIARYHDINTIKQQVIKINDYNDKQHISSSEAVYITDTLHLSSDSQHPIDINSGVQYEGFVIHKDISMYSWIEKISKRKEKSDNNEETKSVKTYNYIKQWTSKYYNHAYFKYPDGHYNPQNNQFMSSQNINSYFWSNKIMLGLYYVSNNIRSMLINDFSSSWNDITQNVYNKYYHSKKQWMMKNGYIYLSYDGEIDVDEANIGDIRIKWTALNLNGFKATFLGSIANSNELNKYISTNKYEYIYLKVGSTDSIQDIIDSFNSDNVGTLYLLRFLTLLFMCIGFICSSSLVNYIFSYIPICGNLIGSVLNIVACTVGLIFWLFFFGIAYITTRKEVAILLIIIIILALCIMQKNVIQTIIKVDVVKRSQLLIQREATTILPEMAGSNIPNLSASLIPFISSIPFNSSSINH